MFKAGDRVQFNGPDWATGYDEVGITWTGTVVSADETAAFESYYILPDPEWSVWLNTEQDGTISIVKEALELI